MTDPVSTAVVAEMRRLRAELADAHAATERAGAAEDARRRMESCGDGSMGGCGKCLECNRECIEDLEQTNTRLRLAVAVVCSAVETLRCRWRDFTSQEMYGESLRAALPEEDFAALADAVVAVAHACDALPASDKPANRQLPQEPKP